jgi:hypothetical protein
MATVRASTPLQPTDTVQTVDEAPSAHRASPSTRGGRGDGPRAAGGGTVAGTGRSEARDAAQPCHPDLSSGATARRACRAARRRPGAVAARRRAWTQHLPPTAHPHPRARGRGDGPRGRAAERGKYRPAQLRHGAGRASASRRTTMRHPSRPAPHTSRMRVPSARRASHPRAGGRGDAQRAAGGGTGVKRVMPPNRRTRKLSPGAPATRACRLRVGIPAR